MSVYEDILEYKKDVSLVIVTKNRSKKEILKYYDLNHRDFGENKAQELLTKVDLKDDIKWHFIGHLQKNKVRSIMPYVSLIQSVDSLNLIKIIDKEANRINKIVDVLIEFNISKESNKTGLDISVAKEFFKETKDLKNVNIKGIMVMGPNVDDENQIREVFSKAKNLYDKFRDEYNLSILSMGMSKDYRLAIDEGSNMIRIGTILFEE